MKTLMFFAFCCLFGGIISATEICVLERLVGVLIIVESGGDNSVVGDKKLHNKAYGCLQIRQPVCDDINRRFKTKYRAEDCLDNRKLSIEICKKYLSMWGGKSPTNEKLARIWNGGPNGLKKKSTEAYWVKVQKIMGVV